jgi:hypothetical protein
VHASGRDFRSSRADRHSCTVNMITVTSTCPSRALPVHARILAVADKSLLIWAPTRSRKPDGLLRWGPGTELWDSRGRIPHRSTKHQRLTSDSCHNCQRCHSSRHTRREDVAVYVANVLAEDEKDRREVSLRVYNSLVPTVKFMAFR